FWRRSAALVDDHRPRPQLDTRDAVGVGDRMGRTALEPAAAGRPLGARTDPAPGPALPVSGAGALAGLPACRRYVADVGERAVDVVLRPQGRGLDVPRRAGVAAAVLHQLGHPALQPAMSGGPLDARLDPGPGLAP